MRVKILFYIFHWLSKLTLLQLIGILFITGEAYVYIEVSFDLKVCPLKWLSCRIQLKYFGMYNLKLITKKISQLVGLQATDLLGVRSLCLTWFAATVGVCPRLSEPRRYLLASHSTLLR